MADLPPGPFGVIVADPPWRFDSHAKRKHGEVKSRAAVAHYPVMKLQDIANIPVEEITEPDAVLFLWAVGSMLPQALNVMGAWGFAPVSQMVWVKPSIGMGYWTRNRHENILIGRRGKPSPPFAGLRRDSVIEAPRRRHSQKPDELQDWIDQAWPEAAKLEMFARRPRDGWAVWGNEV